MAGTVHFDCNGAHMVKVGRKKEGVKRRSWHSGRTPGMVEFIKGCLAIAICAKEKFSHAALAQPIHPLHLSICGICGG